MPPLPATPTAIVKPVSAFEFTGSHDSIGFKPHILDSGSNNTNNNNNHVTMNNNHINHYQHQHAIVIAHPTAVASPTHTIRSATSSPPLEANGGGDADGGHGGGGGGSDTGSDSPPLIVDNLPGSPISLCNSSNADADRLSAGSQPSHGQSPGAQRSSLLDILMHPDRCQEFIQYQVHNGMLLPTAAAVAAAAATTNTATATVVALEARLSTWEVLQETSARLLFMAVHWVRWQGTLQTLSVDDQQMLLQVS